MYRLSLVVAVLSVTVAAYAQPDRSGQPRPSKPSARQDRLTGTAKILYVRDELELTPEQRKKYDKLADEFKARHKEQSEKIRTQIEALREAAKKKAGDDPAAMDKLDLDKMLKDIAPSKKLLRKFYKELDLILDDRQREVLADVQKRLAQAETAATRLIKPREAVRMTAELGLTEDQQAALRDVQDAFRIKMGKVRARDQMTRRANATQFVRELRRVLTDEQRTAFDVKVKEIAPGLLDQILELDAAKEAGSGE